MAAKNSDKWHPSNRMINCKLIDTYGTALWVGLNERSVPSEIRRPTGRLIDPSPTDAYFCASMGIKVEQVEEFRVFKLYYASYWGNIAEFREVAA